MATTAANLATSKCTSIHNHNLPENQSPHHHFLPPHCSITAHLSYITMRKKAQAMLTDNRCRERERVREMQAQYQDIQNHN